MTFLKSAKRLKLTKRSITFRVTLFVYAALVLGYFLEKLVGMLSSSWSNSSLDLLIKIVLPLIFGAFSWTLLKDVIEDLLDKEIGDEKENLKLDFEQKEKQLLERTPEALREKQELEFLSILQDVLRSIDNIEFNDLCSSISQELRSSISSFRKKLKEHTSYVVASQKAVEALSNDKNVLMPIVREACDKILSRKIDDPITEEVECFYDDIYAYLKAWLICSIKYDTPMSIKPIRRAFQNADMYIDTLTFVKDSILEDVKAKRLVETESRKIIKDYLDKLIDLLNDEIASQQNY